MKNTSLILLSILLLSSVLSAQESIMFDKQFIFDNHGSYPRDLKQTPDGGYICAGGIGFSMYDDRYLLFKTDSLGELEWYTYSDSSAVHSTLWAVDLTKTGGYVGIGSTQDNPDWHNSGAIVMYDSLGDTLWTKQYAFNNPFSPETKYEINFYDGKCTNDNCILAVGGINTTESSNVNPIIMKTNLQGDTLWTWRLFEEGNRIRIMSVAETQEGDYVAVGRADKPIVDTEKTTYAPQRGFIVKLSSDGELIYLKEWTDIDYNLFDDVAINSAGELLIGGLYWHHPPEYPDDSYHALLVKTDNNGETIFYNQIEYGKNIGTRTLSVSDNDDIILVLMYESLLGYDTWHYDVLLQRYSNFGELLCKQYIGGQDIDVWPHSVISTNDNGVAFCGSYSTDTSLCSWLVKTDSLGNGPYGQGWINSIHEMNSSQAVDLYPNPAKNIVNIKLPMENYGFDVEIFGFDGRMIKRLNNQHNTVSVGDLKNGAYILKIISEKQIFMKKILIQK